MKRQLFALLTAAALAAFSFGAHGQTYQGPGTAGQVPISNGNAGLPIWGSSNHLVIYTVAPNTASAIDKLRADFVGNGTSDQTAINAAFAAAGNTIAGVQLLPGDYTTNDTIVFPDALDTFFFSSEGARISCGHATHDCISIRGATHSTFRFGNVRSSSSGSAINITPVTAGKDFIANFVSWENIQGVASNIGTGMTLNANGIGLHSTVFAGAWISGFSKGVLGLGTAVSPDFDTITFSANAIYNNSLYAIDLGNGIAATGNANLWIVNLDCGSSGFASAVCIRTSFTNDTWKAQIFTATVPMSEKNLVLITGACNNQFDFTPNLLNNFAGTLTDGSGCSASNRLNGVALNVANAAFGHVALFGVNTLGNFADGGALGVVTVSQSVNFNVANTDTQFSIPLPTGLTRYQVDSVRISGASASISTATAGLFTAAAGGGVAIVTGASTLTVTATADATNNNSQTMTLNNAGTESYTAATLYFRVANAQGSAATATITISIKPLP